MPARTLAALGVFVVGTFTSAGVPAAPPLRVVLIAPDMAASATLAPLHAALSKTPGLQPTLARDASPSQANSTLASLREADVALIVQGPGALGETDAGILREFLRSGKSLVVVAADPGSWPSEPNFQADVLGAVQTGPFAAGAPLTVINLFPHPIFARIDRLDFDAAIPLFEKLAPDAQMIMEGTVGEATAPLAWVRRRLDGRLCHIVPGESALFSEPSYQRLVGNAVLWSAGHPIPGAPAAVQRTFMPDSYPGAFAITLPNGPGVCLDPVRGGINYIWDGDFVDLRPRWITKQGEPAQIFGDIFYREKAWRPLRAGAPNRESDFQFRGYTLQDGFPEFHYEIGGRDVHEKLTPTASGGLLRRFRVGPGDTPLWLSLESQPAAKLTVRGLERDGDLATFTSKLAGEFTMEIRRKQVVAP